MSRRSLASPPLACKTDKIDSQVLAVLSHRDLVPAIWLPDPRVREKRELARFRLHLVKQKSALKNRFLDPDQLSGSRGDALGAPPESPEPWRGNITASAKPIDDLERRITEINRRLKEGDADHP